MVNSLRCCLACLLPCGALDLIRIVHLNGFVEELSRPISAAEILAANPNQILTKPTSQGMVHRILILSPDSYLKRGHIYFLIPASSVPEMKKKKSRASNTKKSSPIKNEHNSGNIFDAKKSSRQDRRGGKVSSVWRPYLQSISEDL